MSPKLSNSLSHNECWSPCGRERRAAAVFSRSSVGSDAATGVQSALEGGNSIGLSVSEEIASMSAYGNHQCQSRASSASTNMYCTKQIFLVKVPLKNAEDLELEWDSPNFFHCIGYFSALQI